MPLPNFIIIGAMKCGTSTLQAQLVHQPGVFMSTPKEPNFFSDDAIYANGLAWYEQLFETAASDDWKGEASTHYTKLPTYPETILRMQQVLKSPKFIYLIRNPVARAVSHYVHEWTMGNMSNDIDAEFDKHPELVDYGRYAYQIEPYLKSFGCQAIMLCTLEEMMRTPQEFLNRVGTFLELSGPLIWREEQTKVNVSAERIRRLPFHGLLVDNPFATALRRTLIPKSLRERVRNSRQMIDRPSLSSERRQALEVLFAKDHAELVSLFPDSHNIDAAYPFLDQ